MAKTLLVLGASMEHVELLRLLRSAGYRVITADRDPGAPAHQRADVAVYSEDEQSLLAAAARESVSGVMAPFSSADTLRAARLCSKLQLPYVSEAAIAVLASRNKFREHLVELALPHPQTHVITRDTELPESVLAAHAWVMRPDRSKGGGPELISSIEQAKPSIARLLPEGSDEVVLLERYVPGQHSLCAAAVREGTVAKAWFIDRAVSDRLQTTGLRIPSKLSHHLRKQSMQLLQQVIGSLKLTNVMLLAEFVSAENKVYLLDLAPRLPAYGALEMVKQSCGADLAAVAGALACGDELPVAPERSEKAWGVSLLGPRSAGRLDFDMAAAESLSEQSWVHGLSWFVPRGTLIEQGSPLMAAAGRAYITGRDRDAVDARVLELSNRLKVTTI